MNALCSQRDRRGEWASPGSTKSSELGGCEPQQFADVTEAGVGVDVNRKAAAVCCLSDKEQHLMLVVGCELLWLLHSHVGLCVFRRDERIHQPCMVCILTSPRG